MAYRLLLWDEAEQELEGAARWYEEKRSGLGQELLDAVEHSIDYVREAPFQYPLVEDQVRRVLTDRFPYSVYFRIRENTVEVLAILHQARHPSHWQRRARSRP